MGILEMSWNGIQKDLAFQTSEDSTGFHLLTKVNVELFDAKKSISDLNEECKDLHRGSDGVVKLWPDVDVDAKIEFLETCK